jgi:tetratricopeptide (TPR) repeat protein
MFSAQVELLWSGDRRARLAERAQRAQVDLGRGLELIDEAADSWTQAATASCEGEQAPAVDDPVRVCLERWAFNFESILDLLEQGDELTFNGLPDLVASLPVPGGQTCASILRASDPGLATLVTEVEASWVDDPVRAERQSQAALVRAHELTAGRRYDPELALAYIARADALRGRRELDASADAFALAHEQATGLMDPKLMLFVRVMWAKVLAHMQTSEATAKAELLLDIAEPLLSLIDAGPDERLRAELLETRGLVERNLGRYELARTAYRAAARLYKEQGELIYAARAVVGEAIVEHDAEDYERAEALQREAILTFEALGVPPAYPRLLQARFDLALVLFDYAYEPSSDDATAQLAESLALLTSVAELARAPLRQNAIAAVCQVAAEAGEREILLRYLDEGRAALASNDRILRREELEAQLALATLVGLQTAEAEDAVEALIFSRPEPLEPSLRVDVATTWLMYLESKSCERYERDLARVREIEAIVAHERFESWLAEPRECE